MSNRRNHSTTPPPDYETWTNADLIKRVTELEARLRARNLSELGKQTNNDRAPPYPPSASPLPVGPPLKKPRKASKPFDASRYHTRLIALKFAYLGGRYNGFEHHNNNQTLLPTIEEELFRALRKTKLIFPTGSDGQPIRDADTEEVSWEGCDYSKCGRTDRGVSAFGQVIGVRVRSNRPKKSRPQAQESAVMADETNGVDAIVGSEDETSFDSVRDELPYIQILNRVLPPDIRILAWCPNPPDDFSARFSCRERRYRYFFTNPAYCPSRPSGSINDKLGEGYLDIPAMQAAAEKYIGLHDFRNLCKIDPSKQLTNFERRIFHAGIHRVGSNDGTPDGSGAMAAPEIYYFEVRGSAFLWHQVRHLVAVLFLVGQGYESPSLVDDLLDIEKTPAKPMYEMASDVPLVLWDCIFPAQETTQDLDHSMTGVSNLNGYTDTLDWVYVGDEAGGRDSAKRATLRSEGGKYGRNGIMDDLWTLWRQHKMEEVLSWSLLDVVARQGKSSDGVKIDHQNPVDISARVFDGASTPRSVGTYTPVMQRSRMETPEVVNARYAARKGLTDVTKSHGDHDADE